MERDEVLIPFAIFSNDLLLGIETGRNFRDACYRLLGSNTLFDEDKLTFDGVRLSCKGVESLAKHGWGRYEIWREGYTCTGEYSPETLVCYGWGKSFEEACRRTLRNDRDYDPEKNTIWGCKLYPTQEQARGI